MGELLDPDGPWTMEMIELMLPVAMQLDAERTEEMFGAVAAGASSLFDKRGVKAFREGITQVKNAARSASRRARGVSEEDTTARVESAADQLLAIGQKLGLRNVKNRKRLPKGPTKIEGPK